MWISEQLRFDGSAELPLTGVVTRVEGSKVDVNSFMPFSGLDCVGSAGMEALPQVGDEVLVLPTMGGYYCAGRVLPVSTAEGEVVLRSGGGAFLRLRADGYAEINGLVISPQGEIVTPTS